MSPSCAISSCDRTHNGRPDPYNRRADSRLIQPVEFREDDGLDESRPEARVVHASDQLAQLASLSSEPQLTAFESRRSTLQAYLDYAPRLDAEDRAEFCADAHRIAAAALEAAASDAERSIALKLWAELCIWESDGLYEPDRSHQLRQAVAKLEQATSADPGHLAARKVLARALSKLAERDDHYRAAYSDFERASQSAPDDWRVWHDWAQMLSEHASHVESSRARELLGQAAELLRRGGDQVVTPEAVARLHEGRGLTLRALAQRSSAPEGLAHRECSQAEFQRATEREPGLESAWRHWAELLLEQAQFAQTLEDQKELQQKALEVLWRGTQAMTDRAAASRLSLQRGVALFAIARASSAAEAESFFEEAKHELIRAADFDPAHSEVFRTAAELARSRAKLAVPSRARAQLGAALELLGRGLATANTDPSRALLHTACGTTWAEMAGLRAGKLRETALDQAEREFERATFLDLTAAMPWCAWAEVACERARRAETTSARETTQRAFDLLTQGLTHVTGESASELLHARGQVSLVAAELYSSSERATELDRAIADFERACDVRRTYVAAWRSWSGVFTSRARRARRLDTALSLFERADDVLDTAVQSVPLGEGTAALLTERAHIFLLQAKHLRGSERRGCYERALACLEEATQLAPASGWAWKAWGRTHAERARYDETIDATDCFVIALGAYDRASEHFDLSTRHEVWIDLARELGMFARRDPDAASGLVDSLADRLEHAASEVPSQRARYRLARGTLYEEAGRYAAAEADYVDGRRAAAPVREALYCQHRLSALRDGRGRAAGERRRTLRAYARYVRHHTPNPDPEVLGLWASVSYETHGPTEAVEMRMADAIARRAPARTWLLTSMELSRERGEADPRARLELIDRTRALQVELEALELPPADRELLLGELALHTAEYPRAARRLATALALDPWNASASETLGRVRLAQGALPDACEQLEHALSLAPRDFATLPLYAAALARSGEFDAADRAYAQAQACAPEDARVLLGWAEACLLRAHASQIDVESEMYVRALEYADSAIRAVRAGACRRLRPKQLAQAYYVRGYARLKLVEHGKHGLGSDWVLSARKDLRTAFRIHPRHHEAPRALTQLAADGVVRRAEAQRAAVGIVSFLALGDFVFAQLSFWATTMPVLQLCLGSACSPAIPLQALDVFGYCVVTFGALGCTGLALLLPHWLRLQPKAIALEHRPLEPEATRSCEP